MTCPLIYTWKRWLTQRKFWVPTLTLIPFVYIFGWILSQLISIIFFQLSKNQVGLIGSLLSFTAFLFILPSWFKYRWKNSNHIAFVGLDLLPLKRSSKFFLRGLFYSFLLISFVLIPLLLTSWCSWTGQLSIGQFFNGIALVLGVGFAEELIFRGWLLTEMHYLIGPKR